MTAYKNIFQVYKMFWKCFSLFEFTKCFGKCFSLFKFTKSFGKCFSLFEFTKSFENVFLSLNLQNLLKMFFSLLCSIKRRDYKGT